MESKIINMIKNIRGEENPDVIKKETNRYRVAIRERDAVAVYMFSAPIRYDNSYDVPNYSFIASDNCHVLRGSNSTIKVFDERIDLYKNGKKFSLCFPNINHFTRQDDALVAENIKLYPTTNGVAIEISGNECVFTLSTNAINCKTRKNTKYFALMEAKFKPYITLSGMYGIDDDNIYPIIVASKLLNDAEYRIHISCKGGLNSKMLLEFNGYERKLIQDTTVDSAYPNENNSYGGMAFVEKSVSGYEQRLYGKIDFDLISDLMTKGIKSVKLYIPVINTDNRLSVYNMIRRFCSIGSNWNNKIRHSSNLMDSIFVKDYVVVDITKNICDSKHHLRRSNGILIKLPDGIIGKTVMATGDNYFLPQVIEIKYIR